LCLSADENKGGFTGLINKTVKIPWQALLGESNLPINGYKWNLFLNFK